MMALAGLLVTTFLQTHTSNGYDTARLTATRDRTKQKPKSSTIQFLEADLDQEPSFVFRDYILQQDLTLESLP